MSASSSTAIIWVQSGEKFTSGSSMTLSNRGAKTLRAVSFTIVLLLACSSKHAERISCVVTKFIKKNMSFSYTNDVRRSLGGGSGRSQSFSFSFINHFSSKNTINGETWRSQSTSPRLFRNENFLLPQIQKHSFQLESCNMLSLSLILNPTTCAICFNQNYFSKSKLFSES